MQRTEAEEEIALSNESILERRLSRIFAEGRLYVQHEDDLVDRRLKWLITISGFLFAAYGGSLIASANDAIEPNQKIVVSLARIGMGVAGFLSCLIGASSINAAHRAIKAINRKYSSFVLENEAGIREEKLHAWQLIGDRPNKLPGFASSLAQPYLIAVAWFSLVMLEIFLAFRDPKIIERLGAFTDADWVSIRAGVILLLLFAGIAALLIWHTMKALGKAGAFAPKSQPDSTIDEATDKFKEISDESFRQTLPFSKADKSGRLNADV